MWPALSTHRSTSSGPDAPQNTAVDPDPAAARDAALKGLGQAPEGSAAAVRVACQLTRAYARLGDQQGFHDALRDTRLRLDGLRSLGTGLFSADAGRIASYAATSAIWLEQPQRALGYAEDALGFYAKVAPGQRSPTREAISRLDLSLALVGLGAPDGAAQEAFRALNSERLTGSVLARAGELDIVMQQRYPGCRGTEEYHERYMALANPAHRPGITSA